jgi:hypothetical protein
MRLFRRDLRFSDVLRIKTLNPTNGGHMFRSATFVLLVLVIVFSITTNAFAQPSQEPITQPAVQPLGDAPPLRTVQTAPAATGNKQVLREGTEVPLKFAEDISSKTAAVDDTVALVLDEDIKVGDIIVARAGAKAVATVSNVRKAGMMGKAGELNIRLESMKVGDTKVRLRGTKGREGDSKVGTAVALTVLFGPIGLIKHGKNIDVKTGTPLKAYIADDVALTAAP